MDFAKLLLALSNPDDVVCLTNFMESNYIKARFKYQGLQNCTKEEQVEKITSLLDEYLKVRMAEHGTSCFLMYRLILFW